MTLVLPVLRHLSLTARDEKVEQTILSSILALATGNPPAFKETLTKLSSTKREYLESILRAALVEKNGTEGEELPTKPSILLKSNFASVDE